MTKSAFDKIMRGLKQAKAHAKGRKVTRLRVTKIKVERRDVASLRMREGLTQAQFAELLGTSLGTVRKWETGERRPTGAAVRLLHLLDARPKVVTHTLGIKPASALRRPRSTLASAL